MNESSCLRVMTWNLWWRFGPQWRDRQPAIVSAVQAADPDVVALQEVWRQGARTQPDEIARQLGMCSLYAATSLPPVPVPPEEPDQAGCEMGIGLLSRWPVLAARTVELPAVHRASPTALVATLDHPTGHLHVVASVLEWEPQFRDDHLAQASALVSLTRDVALDGPLPVILAGDCNAPPGSEVYGVLTRGLVDAWVDAAGDPDAVSLPSSHPQAPLEAVDLIDRRIDHILFRPGSSEQVVRAERAVLSGWPSDGLYPSDHRAIVCDVRW